MAILITSSPVCTPSSVALGDRLAIQQWLRSTLARESATVTYSLGGGHDVYFDVAGHSMKEITRDEVVGPMAEEVRHYCVLAAQGPRVPIRLTISEKVVGETGSPKHDACGVTLK